jgi:hypothetical protein
MSLFTILGLDKNQTLLKNAKDAYSKIKFTSHGYGYMPQDVLRIDSSLFEYTKCLEQLLAACRSDPQLCDEVTKQYIIENMVRVTDVMHSNHACDTICLEFLALLATGETGANFLHSYYLPNITRWTHSSYNATFRSKAVPVLRNVDETIRNKEEKLHQIAREQGKESLTTLQLNNSSIGILLNTTNKGVRRRVEALPHLYVDLTRQQFCGIFPKSCPGCIGLNLICAAEMLNDSYLVWKVVKEILNDPPGEILTLNELEKLRRLSKSAYRRQGDSYPYMGNCIDFGMDSQIVGVAKGLGELIQSPSFASAMRNNRSKCIGYVTAKFSGKNSQSIEEFCNSI